MVQSFSEKEIRYYFDENKESRCRFLKMIYDFVLEDGTMIEKEVTFTGETKDEQQGDSFIE